MDLRQKLSLQMCKTKEIENNSWQGIQNVWRKEIPKYA